MPDFSINLDYIFEDDASFSSVDRRESNQQWMVKITRSGCRR